MKWYRTILLSGMALASIGAKKPEPDLERIVDAASGHMVAAAINGRPMRLHVELDTAGRVTVNAVAAERAGLNGSMIKGSLPYSSVKVRFNTSVTRVKLVPLNQKNRIGWTDRVIIDNADGIVGPGYLPENRVTLTLGKPVAGERTIEIPVDNSPFYGVRHKLRIGDETIWVRFAPHRAKSFATAAAGAHLAALMDGHWDGEPQLVRIELGIDRPARPMVLRKPFAIEGLAAGAFLVRTADYRGKFQLPPDEEPDEDEIVVTGKKSKGSARLTLTLGRDALGGCSSITHDKRREMLVLRCL